MRLGSIVTIVIGVLLATYVAGATPTVTGTDNDDVVVYGRMHHWAIGEGGGGTWRYDGEGGCVFEKDIYNSPTMRGDFDHEDDYLGYGAWTVSGELGSDWICSPTEFDGGSLVCKLLFYKVDTDTVNYYHTNIYGDIMGNASSGSGDTIYTCPTWHCHANGGGGIDDIIGGTAGDSLYGEDGVDEIRGDAGGDQIYGGGGNDWLYGDAGNDYLYGQADSDHLYGGDDTDYLYADETTGDYDYCYGDGGTDTCSTSSPYYCEW
jgi:Ca2+-binding RTX toxin-like protein